MSHTSFLNQLKHDYNINVSRHKNVCNHFRLRADTWSFQDIVMKAVLYITVNQDIALPAVKLMCKHNKSSFTALSAPNWDFWRKVHGPKK